MARWSPDDGLRRAMVVTAHPDDVDFASAGTVAAFVAAGIEVAYCIATSGEAGGDDRAATREGMAALRQAEQRAAAAEVGVTDVTFLGYPDGRLQPTLELRRDIAREIRRFRPDRVLTQSPQRNWASVYGDHPDHLAAGEAAACAVYPDARNPFAHPELLEEGLEPHNVRELWLMAAPEPTVAVDITPNFERKLAALRRHESQVGAGDHLEAMLREWNGAQSRTAGLPEARLAEAFRSLPTA